VTIDDLHKYITARGYVVTRDGDAISCAGDLYLGSLTSLPEGVTLSAGGYLYLRSLTSLPEGVTLSVGGSLYLGILTSETQVYQGQTIRLRNIDYITTRLISSRKVGDVTLWRAQYFRGHLDADPRCYVAQGGADYAHGESAEEALRDLRFKVAQRDLDPDELVAEIKARGVVTFNDYRLLTGACAEGLRDGLRQRGRPDAEDMPLAEALALCVGGYGGDTFRRLMGVA